jgi:hypothetical protein
MGFDLVEICPRMWMASASAPAAAPAPVWNAASALDASDVAVRGEAGISASTPSCSSRAASTRWSGRVHWYDMSKHSG